MKFNLNQFLLAVSDALDFVEIDTLGASSFHTKRVAYISLRIAEYFNYSKEELFDLCSFSILHDNGLSEESCANDASLNPEVKNIHVMEKYTAHCEIGERNIIDFPFFTNNKNIVKYHHENFDGSGFFGLKEEEIPHMAQIIALADTVDNLFHFEIPSIENRKKIREFINKNVNRYYSPKLVEVFNQIEKDTSFWLDLQSTKLEEIILRKLPNFILDIEFEKLVNLTEVFRKIVDSNSKFTARHSSGLSQKVQTMAKYYKYDEEKVYKLTIAANLHDLGKLAIPNSILDKNGKLTEEEFAIIKSHTYYTRQALEKIDGFEEIVEWASNHHEKLDGKGYPYQMTKDKLCFDSRLMTCLDIYQALTEDRPYREGMGHEKAMDILYNQASSGYIDLNIVKDVDEIFK